MNVRKSFEHSSFNVLSKSRTNLYQVVNRLYAKADPPLQRIKKEFTPLFTLLDCIFTVFDSIKSTTSIEEIDVIWDELTPDDSSKQSTGFVRPDRDFYSFRVHRWYEATVVFGGVYYLICTEREGFKDILEHLERKAAYNSTTRPYFELFKDEVIDWKRKVRENPALYGDGTVPEDDDDHSCYSRMNEDYEEVMKDRAAKKLKKIQEATKGGTKEQLLDAYHHALQSENEKGSSGNEFLIAELNERIRVTEMQINIEAPQTVQVVPETSQTSISLDALFANTEMICNGNHDLAQKVFDIINMTVAQQFGSEVEKSNAKAQIILAKMKGAASTSTNKPDEEKDGVMSAAQADIFFYYLFNELGLNFNNSDKTAWARLIRSITGKNEKNIKDALSFDFDKPKTKKDVRKAAEYMKELFPSIVAKMQNDIKEEESDNLE